jgi:cytochrome b
VILLMLSLFVTTTSGILMYGAEDLAGPAAGLFSQSASAWSGVLEEVHELFANFTLLLVGIHVVGVLVESLIHKENLISAMLSGFKSSNSESK